MQPDPPLSALSRTFTDPDSRILKTADASYHYCCNAQGRG
jgi:hypothetical protein